MSSLCIIDGDLIGFKASAACETRFVFAIHKDSGRSKQFDNRTAFRSWLKEQDKWEEDDFNVVDDRTAEPIEYCLHTAKKMLEGIHKLSGCKEMKVVVQGEGNFRDDILLPTKYKGGRVDLIKPVHLKAVQDYLCGKYKAEKANAQESDDVLSMYAYEGFKAKKRYVQCTIDKDAKQCSGWLLNWDKMTEPVMISGIGDLTINAQGKLDGSGRKWLYYQATVGDPSDSYNPSQLAKKKYGEKSFFKDFKDLNTDKECWQKIVDIYKGWYPEPFTYKAWNDAERTVDFIDVMQMYFSCAHMRRWENDRVDVKSVIDKMGIEL